MLQEENKVGNDESVSINDGPVPDSHQQLREGEVACARLKQELGLASHGKFIAGSSEFGQIWFEFPSIFLISY